VSRFAVDISDHELADYQRALRIILRYGLITTTWPDAKALPRVRRFSATLRRDLADAFGYRLELHGQTARLVRVKDALEPHGPARARSQSGPGRIFDRRRYAYLMLCLAVLGRAGVQITLSELAGAVAADANRVPGLGYDPDQVGDRRAFVDAVGWLEERGALTLADGSATAWASGTGEALYDVGRDVLFALCRPTRMVQALPSVRSLLGRGSPDPGGAGLVRSGNEERRLAAQAARRSVVEQPVVYFRDVAESVANHLRGASLAEDLRRLTGLRVERRAEGVLLVDTASFSVERFPGNAAPARAAMFLAVEMADRIVDPDGRRVRRLPATSPALAQDELVALVDVGLPKGSLVSPPGFEPDVAEPDQTVGDDEESTQDGRLPFFADSSLRTVVAGILSRYGTSFGDEWHADPERLRVEAVRLLARFDCVRPVPGGVLVMPLIGRYRNTVAVTKRVARPGRREQEELF
jgi:uncharacterized protein (TIGR02678 family)